MDTTLNPVGSPNLQQFLEPSTLCDLEHPVVVRTAATLGAGADTPKEVAVRIYEFVRDDIKHHWVPMGQKASCTLERRVGDCWPKSIAQVALLRAAGIPARFRWIEYHKTLFRGLVPTAVYEGLADPFPFHVLAEAYLNDGWVKADATFDRQLRPDRAISWDGCSDAVALHPDEISADLGFTASFEERIPQIELFFGSSSANSGDAPTTEQFDVESEVVNLHFEFVRFRNRFDEALTTVLRMGR